MPALTPRQDVAMKHKMKGDTDDRHRIERWDATRACSGHPVLLEPGEQAALAILSGLFAVAWSIIGKEGAWRIGVDDKWPNQGACSILSFILQAGMDRWRTIS